MTKDFSEFFDYLGAYQSSASQKHCPSDVGCGGITCGLVGRLNAVIACFLNGGECVTAGLLQRTNRVATSLLESRKCIAAELLHRARGVLA